MQYLIKVEDNQAVGNPISLANFMDINNVTKESIDIKYLASKGYTYIIGKKTVERKPWEQKKFLGYIINKEGYAVKNYEAELKDSKTLENEIDEYKEYLKKDLANIRYLNETSGLYVKDGIKIRTDRESQSKIIGVYQVLESNIISSVYWKFDKRILDTDNHDEYWEELSKTRFNEITKNVLDHVEKSFTAEKIVSDYINNISDVNKLINYDIIEEYNSAYNGLYN